MFKKVMLTVATFAILLVAFGIYQWREDETPSRRNTTSTTPTTDPLSTAPAGSGLDIEGARVDAGLGSVFRMLDEEGNATLVFRAESWEPVSEDEFHVVDPSFRLLLPDGQVAHVSGDEGQILVQQLSERNYNPKRGWLRGNVFLAIDLSSPEERQRRPGRSDPGFHPQQVVKMWLDEVRFDVDLNMLETDGPIRLQSPYGSFEGRGLKLVWSEVDRRIRLLRVNEGHRARVRDVELASLIFEQPGADEDKTATRPAAGDATAAETSGEVASEVDDTNDANKEIRLAGQDATTQPSPDRVDTYRVTFQDDVVARQMEGFEVMGQLDASSLALLLDIEQSDREALARPQSQPASTTQPKTQPTSAPAGDETEEKIPGAKPGAMVELVWSGPLEVVPGNSSEETKDRIERRIQLLAKGEPVSLFSRDQGRAICRELEYHDESGCVWLRGTPEDLVVLAPGAEQRLMAEAVFLDSRKGVARITGAGRMSDRRGDWGGGLAPLTLQAERELDDADAQRVEVSWTRSVDIEFGMAKGAKGLSSISSAMPAGTYLKQAVFEGDVHFLSEDGQAIQAQKIDVVFREPTPDAEGRLPEEVIIDRIVATDRVHVIHQATDVTEHVYCDALDTQMTLDDTGRNVPSVSLVHGKVLARTISARGVWGIAGMARTTRELQATDGVELRFVSVPQPVTEREREQIEARARMQAEAQGIEVGSEEWNRQKETKERELRDRREIVPQRMIARGKVSIIGVQDDEPMHLEAQMLDCTFDHLGREIDRAEVVGTADEPAMVALGGFYIRGERVSADVIAQTAEVPGAGSMRLVSTQDLDGRSVDEPIPVVVSWKEKMVMAGQKNLGHFVGDVEAVSESVRLTCRELQMEFEDKPEPEPRGESVSAESVDWWVLQPVVNAVKGKRETSAGESARRRIQKRPAYLRAIGDAVVLATSREPVAPQRRSLVGQWLTSLLPLPEPKLDPDAVEPDVRLTGRVRGAGPQISVDLIHEHFVIQGAGSLQIEDYRPPERKRSRGSRGSDVEMLTSSSLDSLEGIGPNQTLFTWKNSMSFINPRNTADFEGDVRMTHLAGPSMVQLDRLARAMRVDKRDLLALDDRQANLMCDRFVVEFDRDEAAMNQSTATLGQATRLRRFSASGRMVRLDEGERFVVGTHMSYDAETGIGSLTGSSHIRARFHYRNPETGQMASVPVETFEWDQKTGIITATGASLVAPGR